MDEVVEKIVAEAKKQVSGFGLSLLHLCRCRRLN